MTESRLNPGAAAFSTFLALLLGLSSASGQDGKLQKKAYSKSPEMFQGLVLLKALDLMPKRLQVLAELIPGAAIGVLMNPANSGNERTRKELQSAARTIGVDLRFANAAAN